MYVIGCDFGLRKSGIVVLDEDFNIATQTLIQVSSRGAERLVDIESGFDQIVQPYKHDLVVFVEGYAYGAKYQRESLAELGGVMRRYFCINNLDYWVITPTANKAFVTGTGKATKNYMKKMTKDKWGIAFKSDDICDAHGLARLGMTVMRNRFFRIDLLPDEEVEVVEDIITNKEHYLNANTAKRRTK